MDEFTLKDFLNPNVGENAIEVIYCRDKSKLNMETCGYDHLSVTEKQKLNSIFQEIVAKAGVDFSNPEIQDIQSAVTEMIERIKTGINESGVLNISRTELCGSMAEKTAMWKKSSKQHFIEFDFLAVLQAACDIEADCLECFCVKTPPANLELLKIYYRRLYNSYLKGKIITKDRLAACFTKETNDCLSSCRCLEVDYMELKTDQDWKTYKFEPSSTCSKTQQGCEKCTIDRPTGTLRIKPSVYIGEIGCSLILDWTSKAKTLYALDKRCLPEAEKIDNLTIRIDFLPALELFKSKQQSADVATCSSSDLVLNPTSSEYEHYCFLVPKHCVLCDRDERKDTWRKSGCRAEIDTIVNKLSNKHRKCYQDLKYLIELLNRNATIDIKSYHLKIAVLFHNSSCSDADEDYAKCVFKVLDELQRAYETGQLKSLHSQSNLLKQTDISDYKYLSKCISILKEAICSAVPESDSVSSFIHKFDSAYKRLYKRLYKRYIYRCKQPNRRNVDPCRCRNFLKLTN